ncbi:hypothetical protein [Alicyclobacillus dauci]|uniref:Uncharacterized protein n=1 Tax=Alicyclobacillus dauci TaxID=1475485 RepID=A0ABY6Z7Q8_9BACL|nr:hypothetical protein [Alicyclobacillus dauci]WAH38926.1 hypothetical protein NZD86_10820 [Alicyclobacillus dauci]
MRNRAVEAAMVLAIGAFTTLTVGTYIHDLNSKNPTGLDQQMNHVVQRIERWVEQHEASASSTPLSDVAPTLAASTGAVASKTSPMSTSAVSYGGMSSDDTRLLSIAQSLGNQLTASDWENIVALLQSSNPDEAQAQLSQLLTSKLSTADRQWLQAHFHAKQAFGTDDVVLLQDAFAQVRSMLTPDEQALLRQQLSQFGIPTNH